MGEEDYRRRQDDHLVEPLFGGLGLEHEPAKPPAASARGAGRLARWWAWLGALWPARWRPRR